MGSIPRPSLYWLLALVPVSVTAAALHQDVAAFACSAAAIIPLSGLIGRSTDELANHVGPRLGGLLNATFGNITELIVAGLLVAGGEAEIAKASLVGSIVGNLLLVLGLSFICGGVRRSEQRFSERSAAVHSASLVLALVGLLMPAILRITSSSVMPARVEMLSAVVAAVLMVTYVATVLFTQVTHSHLFETPEVSRGTRWSLRRAIAVPLLAALVVGLESELLVSSLHPALATLHLPVLFVGLILIPVIGNAAEHSTAVLFAIRDRMNVTIEIAVGSSSQVALFVAPAVVFIGLIIGRPMNFVFTGFEIATVTLATVIVTVLCLDGRSNWLEGAQLVGTYVIIAAAAYFVV